MHGLYGKALPPEMRPLRGCQERNADDALLIGRIPDVADAFAIADSKHPDAPPLRFFGNELRAAGIDTQRVA